MNLSSKVIHYLNNFILENNSLFDNNEKVKRDDLIVTKLSGEIFNIIFEKNIDDIKFNLKNHYQYIDKKSWSEIKEFSDSNSFLRFTKNNLEENIKTMVYFCLIELLSANRKGLTIEELEKFKKTSVVMY